MIRTLVHTACFVMIISTSLNAQDNIDFVLSEINKNNKSIISNNQYLESRSIQYKTGITLYNPTVEFEYLFGSVENAGDQSDFLIKQSFDFPTAYFKKKNVANYQIAQGNYQLTAYRQEISLKAKLYWIELIYLNKKQIELTKRLNSAELLESAYQKKLESGDATSLTMNKAKLQLLNLQNDFRSNTSQIVQLNQKLAELNGGVPFAIEDTVYQIQVNVPEFDTLIKAIEVNNPNMKYLEQQQEINLMQVKVSRAMSFPKFEAGYRSQAILGIEYRGPHIGITIPLWENKNRVKYQNAEAYLTELKLEELKNSNYLDIQRKYEEYQSLKVSLEEYQKLMGTVNNIALLDKALSMGEISSIQYFMEVSYFYNTYDSFLLLEKEYHQVIADLYKYQL